MTAARVILVSDTHLSPTAPEAEAFATGTPPQPKFIEPAGIAQLTLVNDLPDPYHL